MSAQLPEEHTKNSWWPVVEYIVLLLVCSLLFAIPLVIAFPDFFTGSRQEFNIENNNLFWFHILNQVAGLSAALFVTWAVIVHRENSSMKTFGITARAKDLMIGFATGAIAMVVFVLTGYCFGLIDFSFTEISTNILKGGLLCFLIALTEEIIIRGYLLFKLKSKVGDFWALVLTSSVFGLMHFFNDSFTWAGWANISLSGFLMGLIILRTGSISSAIGMHWAWNFVQGSVFGFAVSGNKFPGIFKPDTGSFHELMGGDFGAEGSLLLIPITLLFILIVYRYMRRQ